MTPPVQPWATSTVPAAPGIALPSNARRPIRAKRGAHVERTTRDSWVRRVRNLPGPQRIAWLIATLLLICGCWYLVERRLDTRALAMPVDLRQGVVLSPGFRVSHRDRYAVALEVDRRMSSAYLQCQLGVPTMQPCTDDPVVDIRWRLWSGSRQLAAGSSRDIGAASFGDSIVRTIGYFEGSPGTTYTLEVDSLLDGSVLAPTSPRIVVLASPQDPKSNFVFGMLVATVAVPIAGLLVICLIVWVADAYVRPSKS